MQQIYPWNIARRYWSKASMYFTEETVAYYLFWLISIRFRVNSYPGVLLTKIFDILPKIIMEYLGLTLPHFEFLDLYLDMFDQNWCFVLVTDQTFGSAELFGQTSTVRFGPNDRTFFCRTQNFFHIAFNVNGILSYFCFA